MVADEAVLADRQATLSASFEQLGLLISLPAALANIVSRIALSFLFGIELGKLRCVDGCAPLFVEPALAASFAAAFEVLGLLETILGLYELTVLE